METSSKSVNAMSRAMAAKVAKGERIHDLTEKLDKALKFIKSDQSARGLDLLMVIREDLESMQVQSRSDTESSDSESDGETNISEDDDDDADEID
jgi:hypothetical protein